VEVLREEESRMGSPNSCLEADCEGGRNEAYKATECRIVDKQVSQHLRQYTVI
jgi:hypothetical protein